MRKLIIILSFIALKAEAQDSITYIKGFERHCNREFPKLSFVKPWEPKPKIVIWGDRNVSVTASDILIVDDNPVFIKKKNNRKKK